MKGQWQWDVDVPEVAVCPVKLSRSLCGEHRNGDPSDRHVQLVC